MDDNNEEMRKMLEEMVEYPHDVFEYGFGGHGEAAAWALKTIDAKQAQIEAQRWIPVSERLPDDEEAVEIWLQYDDISITAIHYKSWWIMCGDDKLFAEHMVSHWRKPQPPEKGEYE